MPARQAGLGQELYFDSTQVNANADLDSLTADFAAEDLARWTTRSFAHAQDDNK